MRNPASGGARECHSGRSDAPHYTAPHHSPQRPWRVRALAEADRSGLPLIDDGDVITQAELDFAYRWRK